MFAPKSILVPTDFSPYSDNALGHAIDIAKQYHAKVHLLHVIDEYIQQCVGEYCLSNKTIEELEQVSVANAVDKLQKQRDRIAASSSDAEIAISVRQGVPYEEILHEQEEKAMDLIVLSSHGRTGILRILIGSVAEKVLRGAKCPVMLVRG